MHRFKEEWKVNKKSSREAISETLQSSGKAIFSAAATTIGVFIIIAFSSFPMLISFGWLSALVISLSLMGALIVLPLIIYQFTKYRETKN